VLVWRATDGNVLQWLHGHEGPVYKVTWSPDGTRLASCGGSERKAELFVWDANLGTCLRRLKELDSTVLAVAWGSEGDLLVTGRTDGILRWLDASQEGRILATVRAHDGWVRSIQVRPDGRMAASSGEDGLIKLWDIQSRQHLSTMRSNRPYERLTITGVTGLTEAQKVTLRVLGAVE
jgi:WD40 repeat protein